MKYQTLVVWWPDNIQRYGVSGPDQTLNGYTKDGWEVIDIHWTCEVNEQKQEKIVYHLRWRKKETPTWTVKKEK